MSHTTSFVSFFTPPEGTEPDALLGFTLLVLPSSLVSKQVLQLNLINALQTSGVTALDLRFVKTLPSSSVTIYLLCRIRRLPHIEKKNFYEYSTIIAMRIQQLFKDCGYELRPLTDEASLSLARTPFQMRALAEVRRKEELLFLQESYTEYEVYVTYPWEWSYRGQVQFFEILFQLQNNCLVSIYLEPTRLSLLEENHLNRAASPQLMELLWSGGMQGHKIHDIYTAFAQKLEQPYLLRLCLASSTQQALTQLGQVLLTQLQETMFPPVLQFPQNAYEWQAAERNLRNLEWVFWGNIRDDIPDSARLRYLVDSKGASVVFHPPSLAAKKIKVLLVFANPRGLNILRLGQEDRLIRQAIRYGRYRDNIEEPTVLHAATIHDLSRALLDEEFHIVHIAGHGIDTGLLLEDEMGNIAPVPQEPLADLFRTYNKTLRCVLLNACYGLSQGELIALGVPFTIAMEGKLDDQAALEFARGFYDALGAGKEIDFAYDEGRRRVGLAAPGSQFVSKLFKGL